MNNDVLKWLQQWYLSNCDREWEHKWGMEIDTLDNPGWAVSMDLAETRMEKVEFQSTKIDRSEHDWVICRIEHGKFEGFGGPFNLIEVLEIFQTWVMLYDTQHGLGCIPVHMKGDKMNNDILTWLQQWYHSNCDGEWEHDWGVKIDTLDNPGWSVLIDLEETWMEGVEFERIKIERSEHDWISCKVEGRHFKGAGGPFNLIEVLEIFQKWVVVHYKQNGYTISS